jgi:hypothetical protein
MWDLRILEEGVVINENVCIGVDDGNGTVEVMTPELKEVKGPWNHCLHCVLTLQVGLPS